MVSEAAGRAPVVLIWRCFSSLTDARRAFAKQACVYVQTDATRRPIRVGMASKGLEARYRGGTGYALDAAMHLSKNLVFVASTTIACCGSVECELIWRGRRVLTYNNIGKSCPPGSRIAFEHHGDPPDFSDFE